MPTGQSDNAIEFTFEGKNSIPSNETLEAVARENGAVDESETVAQEAAVLAEATESDDSQPNAQNETEPKVFTITVDGQELLVTQKDLLEGHMRNRDYTQKTQKIAAREREIAAKEAQYQQELTTIDQFLKDQHAVKAYMDKAFGTAPPQHLQIDPSQPMTPQMVAEIARQQASYERERLEAQMNARLEEMQNRAQSAAQAVQREKVENVIDEHMNGLLTKYPVLRKFDGIEEVLMADAQKNGRVSSIEDAKARLSAAAENRATIIRALADEEKKVSAVKAANLKRTSPEPSGGRGIKSSTNGKPITMDHKDTKSRIDAGVELIRGFLD